MSDGGGFTATRLGAYTSEGQEKIIVNLRCLEGLDVDSLEAQKFDDKSD